MTKPQRSPATIKMIAYIAKSRGSEADAIEYMLNVATGRLVALGRYSKSLPEGKATKGAFTRTNKKLAPRSKAIKPIANA